MSADTLPIFRVDRSQSMSVEPVGTKPKYWFRDGERRLLFKADARGTGEDWAEVVACQLCKRIGLPHVDYEMAAEFDGENYLRPGVVCENMAPKPTSLVLGNQLLMVVDANYPSAQRFRVRQHTVEAVKNVLRLVHPPPDKWMVNVPDGVSSALDVFSGYMMLDAWIANQDRHHENWGTLILDNQLRLAPTFDHGAALARNLLDNERAERLSTKDRGRTVDAFAKRGRSAIYGSPADPNPLNLVDAFHVFVESVPGAAQAWIDRLRGVDRRTLQDILELVPDERMSGTTKQFTLDLLEANRTRLLT
jgi:hypothetical protein